MSKRFLHEIQTQLAMVKEHLNAIHVPKGPLARPLPPELQERRQKLLARKRQLEEEIIWYNHEPEGEKSNPTQRSADSQANNNPGQTRLSKPGPAPGPAGSKGRGPADRGA